MAGRLQSGENSKRWTVASLCSALCLIVVSPVVAADGLVTVNGSPITKADLQLEAVLRRIPDEEATAHREFLLDQLIGQRLIEQFLARKQVTANRAEVDSQIERLEAFIYRRDETPDALYERLGLSNEQVRERLALSLAWDEYVRRATTDQTLRAYFEAHRRELDGTQRRASHIIIKAAADDAAARSAARQELAGLRKQIVDGVVSFADAAAEHSQGPSAAQGGDVGYFAFRGTMAAEFADAAFALDVAEVSEPVETPFGVHLIKVTDERPGQLSLEDARPQILKRLSRQLWAEQITRERANATIERTDR